MSKGIFVVGFVALFILVFIEKCNDDTLKTIRGNGTITKIDVEINSSAGYKNFEITNLGELDSINTALKEAKEINVQQGGASEIWAHLNVYKNGKNVFFMVHFSNYNGKMIEIENKTFKSDYIFNLIEKYSGKAIR